MINTTSCLLQQLEDAGCKIDVDSFVPQVAQSLPFIPHDATSNQALIGLCVFEPANYDIVLRTVKSMPEASPLDVLTVLVGTQVVPTNRTACYIWRGSVEEYLRKGAGSGVPEFRV